MQIFMLILLTVLLSESATADDAIVGQEKSRKTTPIAKVICHTVPAVRIVTSPSPYRERRTNRPLRESERLFQIGKTITECHWVTDSENRHRKDLL